MKDFESLKIDFIVLYSPKISDENLYSFHRECAKSYLNFYLKTPLRLIDIEKSAVRLKGMLNYGNAILSILCALIFCKVSGFRSVIIPSGFMDANHSFKSTEGVEFLLWNESIEDNFSFVFDARFDLFPDPRKVPFCSDWNLNVMANTVRSQLLAFLPIHEIDNDTLILNMRSGDIFEGRGHSDYVQPPCFFYTDLIQHFKNVEIVTTSDQKNPCINAAINAGAKYSGWISGREDLSRMIYAKNLVLSRSSFPRAALYLSPIKKQFWVFHGVENRGWNHFDWAKRFFFEFGPHTNCVASKGFTPLLEDFHNSEKQIQLIKSEKCRWQKADSENYSDNCSIPSHRNVVSYCK